ADEIRTYPVPNHDHQMALRPGRSRNDDGSKTEQRRGDRCKTEPRPTLSHFGSIIEFVKRAIELSLQLRVSPTMKVAVFACALMPLLCRAAEPLLPTAEGTTWNYEMVKDRPSDSFDLTESTEERFAVAYRMGGTHKI